MNNKVIASIIIGLCALSIIVGVINTAVTPKKITENKKEKTQTFKNIFSGESKIALITLQGAITSEVPDGPFGNFYSSENVKKALKKAYEDNTVKGILLRINSPGGTVSQSQEIYSLILKIRKKKPIAISMADVAASGAYYISAAADRIYADPGTLTGSIGVIMNSLNMQNLLNNKLGIQANIIKSGKFKDLASPYRPLSQDERVLLQNIINTTYQDFVSAIIQGRVKREDNYTLEKTDLTVENIRKYADGRIFTGSQAQKLGFVDLLGSVYDAQNGISKMAKQKFNLPTEKLPVVPYNTPQGLGELFFNIAESFTPDKDLVTSKIPFSAKYPHQPLFIWE